MKNSFTNYDILLNGFNFRMPDINAALGISQLKKIKYFIKRRKKLAKNYFNLNKNLVLNNCITLPDKKFLSQSAWHLFVIKINFKKLRKTKNQFINFMKRKNILVQNHYIPINKFSIEKKKSLYKNAEIYYNSSLSIPIYVNLNLKQQKYIVNCMEKFFLKND